jgi:hypothetical protein
MKTIKATAILGLCTMLMFSAASCVVLLTEDNGNHKGWSKNTNNPHHPMTTNPGHTKGKHK